MGTMDEPSLHDFAGEKAIAQAKAKTDYVAACADADMIDASYVADLFGDWSPALESALTKMVMALRKDDEPDALGYAYDAADELKKLAQKRVEERMARA